MPEAAQTVPELQPVQAPPFLPIPQWNEYFPWPNEGGLRHIVFHAKENGFAPAIRRVGSRVLISTTRFWEIVDAQGGEGA
jgi:hypothetical protein